ncbi:MAG TPA: FAD-dependent oxidoreductase [Chloroflexota bacterium]|jgi:thioredoxin reductase|nr:FAD-dependent oxidoreductase [Chloroflexota bacterium]
MGDTYELVIVGGGPAGASAAIFAARAGVRTLVLDADKGMTRRALVNNLLGFPDGITGPELVERGQQHAKRAGADWQITEATALQPADDILRLTTSDGRTFDADQVLLTTGASAALAHEAGAATRSATEPRMKEAIVVDEQGRTNVPRLWAAGAAAGVSVHVIITAGDAARVAINIISDRKGQRHVDHDVLPTPAATA